MSKAHDILVSLYDHLDTIVSDYGYTYTKQKSSGNGSYAIVTNVGVHFERGVEERSEFVEGTDIPANLEKQSALYLSAPFYLTATVENIPSSVVDADLQRDELRSNIISELRNNYSIETSAMCGAGAVSLDYVQELEVEETKDTQVQVRLELKLTWYEKRVV